MRNLLKRGHVYYVSVGIAPSLQKILGSKSSHVVRSLKTRDHAEAVSKRKEAVHQIQGELLAVKKAARENGVKFAADQWKKKIAAKEFNVNDFVGATNRFKRNNGELAAAEFVNRSFGIHTDLDHLETQWFAESAFNAKTESRYRHVITLLRGHLKSLGLEQCIEVVDSTVALIHKMHTYLDAIDCSVASLVVYPGTEEILYPRAANPAEITVSVLKSGGVGAIPLLPGRGKERLREITSIIRKEIDAV